MSIALKLQEAQILKDNCILQELSNKISQTVLKIEEMIKKGETCLDDKGVLFASDKSNENQVKNWMRRLSRKIGDLRTTHTVAMQMLSQINLLKENNVLLIDKIISSISITIPVWKNQITLLLGLEKLGRDMELEEKITQVTNKFIEKNAKKLRKNINKIEPEKMALSNSSLEQTVNELLVIEKKDSHIRENMKKITLMS